MIEERKRAWNATKGNWGIIRDLNSLNIEEEQDFLDFCKERGLSVGDDPYDGTWDVDYDVLKEAYIEWATDAGVWICPRMRE
jgi:hypothetical protein